MQLPSAGNIVRQAWAQYSKHFVAFREPLIWVMVPTVLTGLLPIIPGTTGGTSLLLGLITAVISLWTSVRIIDASWALHEGKAPPASLTRSLAWGSAGRIIDYAIVSIFYGVVVTIGIIFLIIPGVLFLNWFAFAPLIVLLEGLHGTGALKRSKELVDGRFWPMAWRWIVLNIIPAAIMALAVMAITTMIALATGTMDSAFSSTTTPWWVDLIGSISSVLIMPFILIASVILFAEARKTRA
jgi:hypothetical protein